MKKYRRLANAHPFELFYYHHAAPFSGLGDYIKYLLLVSTYCGSIQFDERLATTYTHTSGECEIDGEMFVKGNQIQHNLSITLLLIGSNRTTLRHTFHFEMM